MQTLNELYKQYFGSSPSQVDRLPGAGSNRVYYRMTNADGTSVIGVEGTSADENRSFFTLAKAFHSAGLSVPAVYAISSDNMCYLQQDLGTVSLFDSLRKGRESGGAYDATEVELLLKTISHLPALQFEGGKCGIFDSCYPQRELDAAGIMFDLNYFKYCYLKLTGIEFNEYKLQADFDHLCSDLLSDCEDTFLYRDFQARNVMLIDGEPYFIDFQGGRRGPIYYDVASFLWQASAHYSAELRNKLIDTYLAALASYRTVNRADFMSHLNLFVLFRTLQVLGAYGYRGLWEKKKHFIDSIPPALKNLADIIATGVCDAYPYLREVALILVANGQERIAKSEVSKLIANDASYLKKSDKPLVVRVYSFSFKKGIPEDTSGNGGGYVFDCRSTHNPGRYEAYKPITGLDIPVKDFLEEDGEILTFLESIYKLADFHVNRFMERGFTDLMFSCGCTGGRHRSVYSAQHLAEHINRKFGIEVRVTHREQGYSFTLPAHSINPAPQMQVMLFAAGLGTRLKPLTDTMPKAMVPVCGKPLIYHVTSRLIHAGADRIVVNVHHFASQITEYIKSQNDFGIDMLVSDETQHLLETGGGIKYAQPLFDSRRPILIHNVDILSNIDLRSFYAENQTADATLLVSSRKTQRYLLFNDDMRLVGWTNIATGEVRTPYSDLDVTCCRMYAFSGIHIISPRLFPLMSPAGTEFGIVPFYLSICDKVCIRGVVGENLQLLDVGKLDSLDQAEAWIASADK